MDELARHRAGGFPDTSLCAQPLPCVRHRLALSNRLHTAGRRWSLPWRIRSNSVARRITARLFDSGQRAPPQSGTHGISAARARPSVFCSSGSIRKGVIAVVALFLRRGGSDFHSGLRSPWPLSGSTAARGIGCVLRLALRGLGLRLEEPAFPSRSHPKIIHMSAASTASKSAVQQMSAMCDRSAGAKSSGDVDHVGKLLITGSRSSATTAKRNLLIKLALRTRTSS
jgi:hypothetical protein